MITCIHSKVKPVKHASPRPNDFTYSPGTGIFISLFFSQTTPLHLASSRGHVDVVNILLQWNANIAQRDADGHNCLDLAVDNGHK